ncbi:MAG TPA: penicillin-binding transpeptidase domain-containing protein [Actinomycetota bacterium]|nr:penicillin-binding transpeptidase domain-containing protein [Actinomycetota bacterium]
MHAQIRRVGTGLVLAFVALFLQLNYVQIFAAERISENPANRLQLIREYSIKRGDILTVDGKTIARSFPTKGLYKYRREYPEGELYGHITGWYSVRYGLDRLERTYHDQLLGESGGLSMQDIEDEFLGAGEQGDDVRTTISSRLQEVARDALGSERGSIIALDPNTGEVRALWSNPSFDPTPLASFDAKEAKKYWTSLNPSSPTSPLVNAATTKGYPPGSTFKVVTTAAALQSGAYKPDTQFPDPQALEPCEGSRERGEACLPLTTEDLTNYTKLPCATGTIDLFDALRVSCDTTFAMIGLDIPGEVFSMAEAVGFNEPIPFDVRTEASQFPDIPDEQAPLRAYAGIGQGDVNATALQMALVAATVARDGVVPQPHLVREVLDARSGRPVRTFDPADLGRAMSEDVAEAVTQMMVAAVENGTGGAAQIPGVSVAGKTGTSQTVQGQNPHTWFIAFAPAADPQLAIAVIVENGGAFGSEATGGAVAAPIAKTVLEADRALREW